MNVFSNVLKRARQASAKNLFLSFALFLALSVGGVMGVNTVSQTGQVDAATSSCGNDSSNSIIRNGASSRSALIAQVKANPGLQKLYASRGLTSADYSRFISDAKPGVALNNATIEVGGKVVATSVGSLGRLKGCQGPGVQTFPVSGAGTFYGNLDENGKAFAPGTKSIPVDVLFNGKGQVQFAVMTSACANPTYQTPVTPTYQCKSLETKSLGNNAYSFTTDASAGHGATISKLVYDFGDGSATQTTTNPSTAVSHTFTKSSTVTVKVYISLPGGGQVILTNCQHRITFTPPPAVLTCTLLTATPGKVDATTGATSYTLKATAAASNATITGYTFSFGDSAKDVTVVTPSTTASTTHVYNPGTANAMVTVTAKNAAGQTISSTLPACKVTITVKTPECKPGVPVGNPQCLPSTLTCVSLTPIADTSNTANSGTAKYSFKAVASTNNATITSYVFDFGDNSPKQPVTTSATSATSAVHAYATGDYTATVVVNGKDAANKPLSNVTSVTCQVPIHVGSQPPKTPGITITKTVDGKKTEVVQLNTNYEYEVTVTNVGQVDLTNAVVTDVPAAGVNLVSENENLGTITNNQWTYTIPTLAQGQSMTFKFTAQLTKSSSDPVDNEACVSDTSVNNNQPLCDHATVTTTPPVTPPAQLVNTGAGNVIGIFGAVAVIGAIAHRLFLGRRLNRQN